MPERLDSKQVLENNSVTDVHPETPFERNLRVLRPVFRGFALYLIVGATFTVCVCILFSANPALDHYRAGAWGMLTGIAGTAIGTLFGSNVLPRLDS
jgi:hypothetical protein